MYQSVKALRKEVGMLIKSLIMAVVLVIAFVFCSTPAFAWPWDTAKKASEEKVEISVSEEGDTVEEVATEEELGERSVAIIERVPDEKTAVQKVTEKKKEDKAAKVAENIKMLKDKDEITRRNAARQLGLIGDKSAVKGLKELLFGSEENVKFDAAQALAKLEDEAGIPALTAALQSEDDQIKIVAARALGDQQVKSAAEDLILALQNSSSRARWDITQALGRIGDKSAVDALSEMLYDSDHRVRSAAAQGLRALEAGVGEDVLREKLEDEDINVSGEAAMALFGIGEDVTPTLIKSLETGDLSLRIRTAFALGKIKDKEVAQALTGALYDSDVRVRRNAARSLGSAGDKSVLNKLSAALKTEEDKEVKRLLEESIKKIKQE
jgi:HEAT repeat protein